MELAKINHEDVIVAKNSVEYVLGLIAVVVIAIITFGKANSMMEKIFVIVLVLSSCVLGLYIRQRISTDGCAKGCRSRATK